ncbi:MAG: hypothetical protein RIR09_1247 [Pseudomonadota bacterium]|jgi:hypothetical protein
MALALQRMPKRGHCEWKVTMKMLWPALLGVLRAFYLVYAVWCLLFPFALLAWGWALWGDFADSQPWLRGVGQGLLAVFAAMALYAIAAVFARRHADDPNPWQSGFMSWFGTLKLFSNAGGAAGVTLGWPSAYLVENPRGYRISGRDSRQILNLLQPGDILLRGYEGYVDGEFIRRSARTSASGFAPGWYTHVALFAGDLTASDAHHVPAVFKDRSDYFAIGPEMVIHSMAKGVHTEDVLTFLRCDYLAVLRLPPVLKQEPHAPGQPHHAAHRQHRPAPSPSDLRCAELVQVLEAGQSVTRDVAVDVARQSALEKIGHAYDFDCSDTQQFHRFSCAELLYYCLRGVQTALTLLPQPHALYPLAPWFPRLHLLERTTITPDDYFSLVASGHLECVWEDAVSQARHAQWEAKP